MIYRGFFFARINFFAYSCFFSYSVKGQPQIVRRNRRNCQTRRAFPQKKSKYYLMSSSAVSRHALPWKECKKIRYRSCPYLNRKFSPAFGYVCYEGSQWIPFRQKINGSKIAHNNLGIDFIKVNLSRLACSKISFDMTFLVANGVVFGTQMQQHLILAQSNVTVSIVPLSMAP